MWIGPSRSAIFPCGLSCDFFKWRLIMRTPSTKTRCLRAMTSSTFPVEPLMVPGNHFHLIALADVQLDSVHKTSGASETIFMKLRSRSSRATGPKIRVPRGFKSLSMMTIALLSKRRTEPS